MKVLVLSDTHRKIKLAQLLIGYYEEHEQIEAVIHCGDHLNDAKILKEMYPGIAFYMVPGNCDSEGYESGTTIHVMIDGVSTMIAHGHKHQVKYDVNELVIDAQAYEATLALYGHTHCADKQVVDGILVFNPGSLSEPRDTTVPSFGLLTIEKNVVKQAEVMIVVGDKKFDKHPYFK